MSPGAVKTEDDFNETFQNNLCKKIRIDLTYISAMRTYVTTFIYYRLKITVLKALPLPITEAEIILNVT